MEPDHPEGVAEAREEALAEAALAGAEWEVVAPEPAPAAIASARVVGQKSLTRRRCLVTT